MNGIHSSTTNNNNHHPNRFGSIDKTDNLHHHPSASNLMQDNTMMSTRQPRQQSAGLSSSPDEDNRTELAGNTTSGSQSFVPTTAVARAMSLTSGSFPPDGGSDNNDQPDLDTMQWEEGDDDDDDDDDDWDDEALCDAFLGEESHTTTERTSNEGNDNENENDNDEAMALNDSNDSDSKRRDSTAELADYHKRLSNENLILLDDDEPPSNSNSKFAATLASEDDYLDREQPEDKEYDNVQHQGCMGRLVMSMDDGLQFYRSGNDKPMVQVASQDMVDLQISPPTYKTPVLRVKTSINQNSSNPHEPNKTRNLMFQLKDQAMAADLRDVIRDFPMATTGAAANSTNPRTSFWTDAERDMLKNNQHDDIQVAAIPYARDKATPLQGVNKDPSDNFSDSEMDVLLNNSSTTNANNGTTAPRKISSFDDEEEDEDEDSDGDWELEKNNKNNNVAAAVDPETGETPQEKSLREYNERKAVERENNDDDGAHSFERRLFNCFMMTCCVSAIVFLLVGGVSGFFIGRSQADNNDGGGGGGNGNGSSSTSSADKDSVVVVPATATSVPTLVPSLIPSPQPTTTASLAPSLSQAPTDAPSWFPTFDPNSNRTLRPTVRGGNFPPRPQEPVDTVVSPTLSPTTKSQEVVAEEPTMQPSIEGEVEQEPVTLPPTTETATNETTTLQPTAELSETTSQPTLDDETAAATTQPTAGQIETTTLQPTVGSSVLTTTLSPSEAEDDSTLAPTTAPTLNTQSPTVLTPLLTSIREFSSDNGTAVGTQGTPQNQAYQWITSAEEEVFVEQLSNDKQLQRYSLATFYYSTGGDSVWGGGGGDGTADATVRQNGVEGSWLDSELDDCEWGYIVCGADDMIVALELLQPMAPSLLGTLPAELGLLTTLTEFVIATGDAEEAATARQARPVILIDSDTSDGRQLQSNDTNPVEIGDINSTMNEAMLTGPLPSELGLLGQLQTLQLNDHALSGVLPSEVGSMQSIVLFDLTNNQLTGEIPIEVGALGQMQELRLGFNLLNQRNLRRRFFNQENGMAQSLTALFLNDNLIEGAIPGSIGLLTSITTGLFLQNNRFSRTPPDQLSELSTMEVLRLDGNLLSSTIPSEWAKWGAIALFRVDSNSLSGEVPGDVCRLFDLKGTEAYTDCDMLECSCCQYCCRGGVCEET